MRNWVVERTDKVGYDEYVSFLISAETKERAVEIAHEQQDGSYSCYELLQGRPEGIILDSYNAC
jgi:hypothetical protein